MKNLSAILFVILFLAVAVLFFFQFSGSRKGVVNTSADAQTANAGGGIAYVNIDTVVFKFNMYSDRRAELLDKQKKAEAELNSKGTQYEKGVKDYQDKVNKGLITRATAAEMEQSLLQQQQELVNLRDKLQSDLLEEDQVMNRQILEYITTYLEEHKDEYNYEYIFGKSFGSVVLYGNSAHDITQKVLDGLNAKYQTEKK
ncbi:MAG TPA: OmpH family outer membrane protein [Bacteroidales bacterium]|jgi:outer membrane protein|nr:OmpH family outer membrane protein [Bacteroidales bacterium]